MFPCRDCERDGTQRRPVSSISKRYIFKMYLLLQQRERRCIRLVEDSYWLIKQLRNALHSARRLLHGLADTRQRCYRTENVLGKHKQRRQIADAQASSTIANYQIS